MSSDFCIPLLQMFSLCPLEGKLLALAEKCTILKVDLNEERAEVILDVALAPDADDTWLRELEQSLAEAYQMNRVVLRPVTPDGRGEVTLPWLREQFSQLFPPAHGLLSGAELETKLMDLKKDLFNLRLQHATNQLDNPIRIAEVKKDIARVKTIIREKQTASAD